MGAHHKAFVPAAGHDWLLPLYDPLLKLLGADSLRRDLIEQAALRPGHRVLDIGCGTGSLAVEIARLHPGVEVVGLDPDPKALERARRKAERAGLSVTFHQGYADELPYPADSFDRVFSSFMLHHLADEQKQRTLREVGRVLAPGGSLHLADFGGPASRRDGFFARRLHSHEEVEPGFGGRIPRWMTEAGLIEAGEIDHRSTLLGRVAMYRARAPQDRASPDSDPVRGG